MTGSERQLILLRLYDKGLLPYDRGEISPTALENLTEREREVFGEELYKEAANLCADLDGLLRVDTVWGSKFEKLKFLLKARWFSIRLFVAKKAKKGAAK